MQGGQLYKSGPATSDRRIQAETMPDIRPGLKTVNSCLRPHEIGASRRKKANAFPPAVRRQARTRWPAHRRGSCRTSAQDFLLRRQRAIPEGLEDLPVVRQQDPRRAKTAGRNGPAVRPGDSQAGPARARRPSTATAQASAKASARAGGQVPAATSSPRPDPGPSAGGGAGKSRPVAGENPPRPVPASSAEPAHCSQTAGADRPIRRRAGAPETGSVAEQDQHRRRRRSAGPRLQADTRPRPRPAGRRRRSGCPTNPGQLQSRAAATTSGGRTDRQVGPADPWQVTTKR